MAIPAKSQSPKLRPQISCSNGLANCGNWQAFFAACLLCAGLLGVANAQDQTGEEVMVPEAKPQMLIAKPKNDPLIPRPRPDPDTAAAGRVSASGADRAAATQAEKPGSEDEACQWRLRALGVAFEPLPPDENVNQCHGKTLLAIRELSPEISVEPEALLTCDTVEALSGWMRDVVLLAAAKHLTAEPTGIVHQPTEICRQYPLSDAPESAPVAGVQSGNIIRLSAITFKERDPLNFHIRDHETGPERIFQRAIRIGACRFFPTALGPRPGLSGAAGAGRGDNLHLDLTSRPDDGRICR